MVCDTSVKNVHTDFSTASFMLADDMLGSSNPGLKKTHHDTYNTTK